MENVSDASVVGALAELQAKMVLAMIDGDGEEDRVDAYRQAYLEMPEELRNALDTMEARRVKALTKQAAVSLARVAEA